MGMELTTRIYLEDTDAGGIVYHASYLRFMERARSELLRAAGFNQSQTFEADLSFVVHEMHLEFRAPAQLDAEVVTTCKLVAVKGARLIFQQEVRDARSPTSYVTAEVSVACITLREKRPRRVPPSLMALVE